MDTNCRCSNVIGILKDLPLVFVRDIWTAFENLFSTDICVSGKLPISIAVKSHFASFNKVSFANLVPYIYVDTVAFGISKECTNKNSSPDSFAGSIISSISLDCIDNIDLHLYSRKQKMKICLLSILLWSGMTFLKCASFLKLLFCFGVVKCNFY